MSSAKTTTRRKFLRQLALGLPAMAAGGALTHIGLTVTRGKGKASAFPGDPAVWRRRFLETARRERGGGVAPALTPAHPEKALVMALPPQAGMVPRAAPAAAPIEESAVLRMQAELKRAMAKPIDQRKWIMVIDLRKCIGCSACTIACKAENHLPPGVVYMSVIEEEIGEYPNVTRRFMPHHCMQCDDPPCVPVCPVNATWKREDGIVVIDYNQCIGCRYCLAACPYGARYFDFGDNYTEGTPEEQPYEEEPSPEYGRAWRRNGGSSPVGNARKCQFCIHRLNAGMLPACVTTCVGGAAYFGDKNDPDSLVNELVATGRAIRLKEELGTEPKVYYLL